MLTQDGSGATLLERSEALATLEQALVDSVDRGGRLVFVSGEAGVGKTTLVRRFCELRSGERGSSGAHATACEHRGRSRRFSTSAPRSAVGWPPPSRPAANRTSCSMRCWRSSRGRRRARARGPALGGRGDARCAAHARPPDRATPALVVATYRDDELERDHPLRIVLGELRTAPTRAGLQLAPLSPARGGALAEPHGVDAGRALQHDRRQPVLRHRGARRRRRRRSRRPSATPCSRASRGSPRGARAARRGRRRPAARRAVAARGARDGELAAARRMPRVGHAAARADGGGVPPRAGAPGGRGVAARRTAGCAAPRARWPRSRVPPAAMPDLARLAHHAEAAEDAAPCSRSRPPRGERAAALGAHREAAAQYERALRFADALPPAQRAALLERHSYECYLTDQHQGAVARAQGGDRLLPGDRRPPQRGRRPLRARGS